MYLQSTRLADLLSQVLYGASSSVMLDKVRRLGTQKHGCNHVVAGADLNMKVAVGVAATATPKMEQLKAGKWDCAAVVLKAYSGHLRCHNICCKKDTGSPGCPGYQSNRSPPQVATQSP